MKSCLYSGMVRHRRFFPVAHEFRYSVFQMYLDLEEVSELFDPFLLWSAKRPAVAWFRREDHLGDAAEPLDVSVRNEVRRQTGHRPDGPIRLLTNLRYFGFIINPVSYFYCFNAATQRLDSVLAEVHNTPWGERHCYVLSAPVNPHNGAAQSLWNDKTFHVSPFMPMSMRYHWRMTEPGEQLAIHLQSHRAEDRDNSEATLAAGCERQTRSFDVTLRMHRKEITSASLARILCTYPCMTAKVAAAIYWQAFRLWLKRVPFVPHPERFKPPKRGIPAL